MGRKFDWLDRMRVANVVIARNIRLGLDREQRKGEYVTRICNLCKCQHYRYRLTNSRKSTPAEIAGRVPKKAEIPS